MFIRNKVEPGEATMRVEERDCTSFHFSTRELSPSNRLPVLREVFGRMVRLDIDAEPGQSIEVKTDAAPGLRRTKMLSSMTARLTRPARMLADGEDSVCLMMKTGGHMALTQRRRESLPQVGDGLFLLYREAALLNLVDATYVAVRVPFAALEPLSKNVEAAAALCIPGNTEALRLLQTYVASLPARIVDPQLARLAAMHVYDLIALAIGATDDARQLASQRGVRAARLEAIKADLVQNGGLNLDQLAARQGITPRYVQMLFEEAGSTFSDFVLERRLDAARRMLASPRYAGWSVTEIALNAGFNDLSHFNRRFKRRYGMTPSDQRAQAKRGELRN